MGNRTTHSRLSLSDPVVGTALRARLLTLPSQPRALLTLLEAIAAWYGAPPLRCGGCVRIGRAALPGEMGVFLGDLDGERVRGE